MISTSTSADTAASRTAFTAWLAVGILAVTLFVIVFAWLSVSQSRRHYEQRAASMTQNLGHLQEENLRGAIDKIDVALLAVADEAARQLADGGIDRQALDRCIARQLTRLPEVQSLRMSDAEGEILYGLFGEGTPGKSIAERAYFNQLRQDPRAEMVISNPFVGLISEQWVILFTRRVNGHDGAFAGAVWAAITLEQLTRTFATLDVGRQGMVSLLDSEMCLIARHPEPQRIGLGVGQQLRISPRLREMLAAGHTEGTYATASSADNRSRTISFHKVGPYPLYLMVGLATEEFLAEWRVEAAKVAAMVGSFALLMLIASWQLFHNEERRKRYEDQLRQATAYNRSLIEASLDPLVTIGPDGTITDVNAATEAVTGRTRQELINTDFCGCFTDREQARAVYREVFAAGLVRDYPLEIIDRNGRVTSVLYNASVYRDEQGQAIGVFAAARDITERKRADKIMQARLRLMQFSAGHSLKELLIKTVDEVERLTDSRAGFYHFLAPDQQTLSLQAWSTRTSREMCQAEGQGLHYDVAKAGVWVDCIHKRQPVIHNDYEALTHKKGLPPGHPPIIRELVVPVFRQDRIVAILGVGNKPSTYDDADTRAVALLADMAWDIAERKRAEEDLSASEARHRRIVETANEGIWSIDQEALTTYVNPLMARMLGYTEGQMRGRPFTDFLFPEDLDDHRAQMAQRRDGQGGSYERRFRRADGGELWCLVSATPVLDADGGYRGSFAMFTDITGRKEEEKFRENIEGILRHDLRSPLVNIAFIPALLRKGDNLTDRQHRLVDELATCAKKMLRMVDAYLKLSKIEKGVFRLQAKDSDLVALLDGVKLELKQLLVPMRKSLVVSRNGSPLLPEDTVLVAGEEILYQTMLTNLIKNALEASPKGAAVEVDLVEQHSELTIAVRNQGAVPEAIRERFFQKYATQGKSGGTGLGAYSARLIAEAHGGSAELDASEPGATTVRVRLPKS